MLRLYYRQMLIGYGSVSATEGEAGGQVDALVRAGVPAENIHIDNVSGARASRPKLDVALERAGGGDTLVVTRLDRLARSVPHLVTLGAELGARGVGLRVLEQGIDTATAEGRAKFEMLSVLADLGRELRASHTRDGLAAARALGRKGGRPPKLTPEQARRAQRLYDEGEHTVARIADLLGVKRGTLYGHLDKGTVGRRPRAPRTRRSTALKAPEPDARDADARDADARDADARDADAPGLAVQSVRPADVPGDARGGVALLAFSASNSAPSRPVERSPARPGTRTGLPGRSLRTALPGRSLRPAGGGGRLGARCPSCGHAPSQARERVRHRQDLAMTWLYPDPRRPGRVLERRHCAACQPHDQVSGVECALCADGPMLAGRLAERGAGLAGPVREWLTAHGWRDRRGLGLVCARHPAGPVSGSEDQGPCSPGGGVITVPSIA